MDAAGWIFLWLIVWVICGLIGMSMADKRNRGKGAGFAIGFLLGLVGLAVIALLGKKDAPRKEESSNVEIGRSSTP